MPGFAFSLINNAISIIFLIYNNSYVLNIFISALKYAEQRLHLKLAKLGEILYLHERFIH